MASMDDLRNTLIEQLNKAASETTESGRLLRIAEAYAWVVSPNQAHGNSD